MAMLHVERIGGLAGFGIAGGHLRSLGWLDTADLSAADQRTVEALFAAGGRRLPATARDTLRYRLSRTTPAGTETVEADEADVPDPIARCVRDELV